MADDRKKKDGEPALEFFWDSLELAADKTFSTTLRIKLSGWWEGGRPREVGVSFYQKGEDPPAGDLVRIQKGFGVHPLTGLFPGHHYLVVCHIGDRLPVQKMITVPELPKPKKPEEEKLERERTELERAKIARQLKQEKKEDKVQPPAKRQIKVLHIYRRPSRLEVVLQRTGRDGKPEEGEISVLDFEQGGVVFGDATGDFPFQIKNWGIVVVSLPYFDFSRQVTFFLPDDPDAKALVDVPAREKPQSPKEVRPASPSLWARMKEVYREERNKGKTPPPFEFKIQRRQPLIFPTDSL